MLPLIPMNVILVPVRSLIGICERFDLHTHFKLSLSVVQTPFSNSFSSFSQTWSNTISQKEDQGAPNSNICTSCHKMRYGEVSRQHSTWHSVREKGTV